MIFLLNKVADMTDQPTVYRFYVEFIGGKRHVSEILLVRWHMPPVGCITVDSPTLEIAKMRREKYL